MEIERCIAPGRPSADDHNIRGLDPHYSTLILAGIRPGCSPEPSWQVTTSAAPPGSAMSSRRSLLSPSRAPDQGQHSTAAPQHFNLAYVADGSKSVALWSSKRFPLAEKTRHVRVLMSTRPRRLD